MAKPIKSAQISEQDPKKLLDLAKEDTKTTDSTKLLMWILERSPTWRMKGYSELKRELGI